jgi:biogenesis of lysosome-related organelles complex 1 subunit 2
MTEQANGLVENIKDLHSKYYSIQPYLGQIDELESSVGQLENVVKALDKYTKDLDSQIKRVCNK